MLNWDEIFKNNPDLEPPGYREAERIVRERWAERPKCGKPKRANRKKAKWPSAKHGSD